MLLGWATRSGVLRSTSRSLRTTAQHRAVGKVLPLLSLLGEAVVDKSNTDVPEVSVCPRLLALLGCARGCAPIPEQGHFNLCGFQWLRLFPGCCVKCLLLAYWKKSKACLHTPMRAHLRSEG